jgi:REP element-mobilizing transposase RayT
LPGASAPETLSNTIENHMPFIKIWVHLVWTTKNRAPLLASAIRQKVFSHIRENARSKGIHLDFVNGHIDHVHCLVSLTQEQTIAGLMQLIKGESAFWINKNNLCKERFEWQNEYFALSVSESKVNIVREYIKKQEEHHQKKNYREEYDEFIEKYGFKTIEG